MSQNNQSAAGTPAVKVGAGQRIKEFFRKLMVSLKRSPHIIALIALVVAFLYYSLNLSAISNTTIKINTANMGQCEFAGMLFSILAFVCITRAFPKRQKPSIPMIGLYFLMSGILIFADAVYASRINEALTREENRIVIDAKNAYIATAQQVMTVHIIMMVICILLVALLPVYSKLLRAVNTSIEVEENREMGEIDISGED